MDNIDGPVRVTGHDGPNVEVTITRSIKAQSPERLEAAKREVQLEISDHADTEELVRWLQTFKQRPQTTFLVHGEPDAASQLQETLASKLGWNIKVAQWLEKVRLE